jgi:hypothetical protein
VQLTETNMKQCETGIKLGETFMNLGEIGWNSETSNPLPPYQHYAEELVMGPYYKSLVLLKIPIHKILGRKATSVALKLLLLSRKIILVRSWMLLLPWDSITTYNGVYYQLPLTVLPPPSTLTPEDTLVYDIVLYTHGYKTSISDWGYLHFVNIYIVYNIYTPFSPNTW